MAGELSVLNVGAGDICVTFNTADDAEAKKAVSMLQDMQRRGYAIMVRLPDETYVRARSIDAERGRYIVVLPDGVPVPADAVPVTEPAAESKAGLDDGPALPRRRGRPRKHTTGIPIAGNKAVGVARSAGG